MIFTEIVRSLWKQMPYIVVKKFEKIDCTLFAKPKKIRLTSSARL